MRIYTYNKDQIKNPDLIYADQIFKIQREVGPNEYLVVKGDWLAKIAGNPEIYDDPTKWTKIFEANKAHLLMLPSFLRSTRRKPMKFRSVLVSKRWRKSDRQ